MNRGSSKLAFKMIALITSAVSYTSSSALAAGIVTEERMLITNASVGLLNDSNSDIAPDLNPWTGLSQTDLTDNLSGEFGHASATQTSSLSQSELQYVHFDGSISATGSTDGFASARSRLVTQIESLGTTRFTIYGTMSSSLGANGSHATARLINSNNVVKHVYDSAFFGLFTDGSHRFRSSGVMPAGTWTLELDFRVSGFEGATDTLSHDITFFLPTPGSVGLLCLGLLGAARRQR